MKVVFFIGSLNRGGAETLVLDTFRRLDVAPFDCILVYRNDGNLSDAFRATGVKMFRVKPKKFKLGYIHSLRKVLHREKVDILHTQTLLNAFLGLFCVCFSRTRLVASFHGFHYSLKNRLFAQLVMWFADASVFVSGHVRNWYLLHTLFVRKQKCHIVYNGIDFSKLDCQYPVPDFLKSLVSVSSDKSVNLASIGSFVSGRSQYFLCQCIRRIKMIGIDNFHFFFVGRRSEAQPERFDTCVRFCEENGLLDRVHFLGERDDVPAILQSIDGFVYASEHDTFGIAVVEAMAAGVPVIVNDWEVMKEVTDNGKYALMYRTGNLDSCADFVKELIEDPVRFKATAQDYSKEIRDRFSIERHIRRLFEVYTTVS